MQGWESNPHLPAYETGSAPLLNALRFVVLSDTVVLQKLSLEHRLSNVWVPRHVAHYGAKHRNKVFKRLVSRQRELQLASFVRDLHSDFHLSVAVHG